VAGGVDTDPATLGVVDARELVLVVGSRSNTGTDITCLVVNTVNLIHQVFILNVTTEIFLVSI